jgi:hypothetical protein
LIRFSFPKPADLASDGFGYVALSRGLSSFAIDNAAVRLKYSNDGDERGIAMGDNNLVHFDPYRFTSSAGVETSSRKLAVEFEAAFEEGPSYEVKWIDENENGSFDVGDRVGFIEYALCIIPGNRASTIWDYQMRGVNSSDVSVYGKRVNEVAGGWDARMDCFKEARSEELGCQKEADDMAISLDWTAGFWTTSSLGGDSILYFENKIYPPIPMLEAVIEKGSPDYAIMLSAFQSCFKSSDKKVAPQRETVAPGPPSSVMPRGYRPTAQP